MIGIVNQDDNFLNEICDKLGKTLKDSGLCYHATKYADLLKHPDGSKFALVISETKNYYNAIMTTLTQKERNLIQWIGSDWFNKEQ